PFSPLPQSVSMKANETHHLTSLTHYTGNPVSVVYDLARKRPKDAMQFAEWRLRAQPADEDLLLAYFQELTSAKESGRGAAFLKAGLTNRPVLVQWHRLYQNIEEESKG